MIRSQRSNSRCFGTLFLYSGEIISKIKEAGFVIALEKEMQLTPEMVEEFYSQHKDKDWFPEFQGHMTRSLSLHSSILIH